MSDQTGAMPAVPFQAQRFASLVQASSADPAADSGLTQGIIASVSTSTDTAMVNIGGAPTASGPIPYLPSCIPVAGQGCWLLPTGNAWLIVGTFGYNQQPVIAQKFTQNAFNDTSNSGTKDFTCTFPLAVPGNGWATIAVSAEFGFSAANVNNCFCQLYTNYVTYSALSGSNNAIQTNFSERVTALASAWQPESPAPLVFPVTTNTTPSFVVRFGWTPNGAGVWMDFIASALVFMS